MDVLEPPLQIAMPNKYKIISMDVPIVTFTDPRSGEVQDNSVFCADLLDIITQDFFARKSRNNLMEETGQQVEGVKVIDKVDKCGQLLNKLLFRFQPFLIALDMKGCHPHCYNKENNIVQILLKRHGNIIEYLPVAGQRKLQTSIDDMNDDPVIKCIFNKDNHHIYQSQLNKTTIFYIFIAHFVLV